MLEASLPGEVLFEGSVSLLGVAAVVGEVDVVDVVAAAAGYRGEVFDGAARGMARG